MPRVNTVDHEWFREIVKFLRMQISATLAIASSISTSFSGFYSIIGDPGEPAAGNSITYSTLEGKSIVAILINGTAINTTDYAFNNVTGEVDLTTFGGVNDGDEVIILYK